MDTRREFIRKAALLSGGAGLLGSLPASIQQALAIDPDHGTTFRDAEHIVILMQENRSFDHCFGTLQGVRGFNDPRAITLPDNRPVWLQTNAHGETYAPFRLDIKETNATWMGGLPHSWSNQVDARNHGNHDKWLDAKPSGHPAYARMPLTLGYYTREDLPFYYALADAFTICDQHFCSSLTGTTPNRLYLWTGTIREKQDASAPANVRNEEVDYGVEAHWTTFPERLEDHGISWKIYQNEISLESGLEGEEDAWLTNFTDNPIEWFAQYRVRHAPSFQNFLRKTEETLALAIDALKTKAAALPDGSDDRKKADADIAEKTEMLTRVRAERAKWTPEDYAKLSQREKNLHEKAFSTNVGDPNHRVLSKLVYHDGDTERQVEVPQGDVLHQFRQDVDGGTLPTVSWLVAPERFSDHPGSAWYGAWYVSEVLDILTKNPAVWKKTIFILTYDENDGYFDHVPPFVAPHPDQPETGRVSSGIDTQVDYVTLEQDLKRKPAAEARGDSIGLGYRVPLVAASPWSRGGCVCSQVFDHTSVLQFLETFLSDKTGKLVQEMNISAWRRTVCGDLTSIFQPYQGEKINLPTFTDRDTVIEGIHRAQFKQPPTGYKVLTSEEIDQAVQSPTASPLLPRQEPGTRRSSPLPYQLYADGTLNPATNQVTLQFEARDAVFGKRTAGSPFLVYAIGLTGGQKVRSYAVAAGGTVTDTWNLGDFEKGTYHLRTHGPNGFLREYRGNGQDPNIGVQVDYVRARSKDKMPTGEIAIQLTNHDSTGHLLEIHDNANPGNPLTQELAAGAAASLIVATKANFGWYDFTIRVAGNSSIEKRYAGRVETGKWSITDPVMGKA